MKILIRLFAVFSIFLTAHSVSAQTTAFAYQGKLTDSGTPQANYQMQFKLFDALTGGNQIGGTIENASIAVNQGVFSVMLDFGANVFAGADRFLEIGVRRNSGENYTILNPRQQIASSPYSIRTLSAQTADLALDSNKLGGVNASEYVTNSTVGSSFIRNGTTPQTGSFNISGGGLFGGNVGIGTTSPAYPLDVYGSIRASRNASTDVIAQTTGGTNSWARFLMITPNRMWAMGTSQNFNGDQFYLTDGTNNQFRLMIHPNGGAVSIPLGNVGVGTTNPLTKLHVQNSGIVETSTDSTNDRAIFSLNSTIGGINRVMTLENGLFGAAGLFGIYDRTAAQARMTIQPNGGEIAFPVGNVTQNRAGGGLVKAMLFIRRNSNNTSTIIRCYNSTLSGAAASTVPCGFGLRRNNTDPVTDEINFGFRTSDRFWSATSTEADRSATAKSCAEYLNACSSETANTMVSVLKSPDGAVRPGDYMLVIY